MKHLNAHGPLYLFRLSTIGREFVQTNKFDRKAYLDDLRSEHFVEDDEFTLYDARWSSLSDTDILEIIVGRIVAHQKPIDIGTRLRKASSILQGVSGDSGAPTKQTDESILNAMMRCWIEDIALDKQPRRKNEGLARHCMPQSTQDFDDDKTELSRLSRKFRRYRKSLFERLYLKDAEEGTKIEENVRHALCALARIKLVDRRFLNPDDEELESLIEFGPAYGKEMSSDRT